ncbi:MAG: hypothetical protein HY232_13030 [Acidobacteria bacterium]|nr:hypothetical protein [Acidobacteriota bacterium]
MPPRAKLSLSSQTRQGEKAPVAVSPAARPDRTGTKVILGHFPKATWAALRRLALEQERTSQALLEEALTDLFAKYKQQV